MVHLKRVSHGVKEQSFLSCLVGYSVLPVSVNEIQGVKPLMLPFFSFLGQNCVGEPEDDLLEEFFPAFIRNSVLSRKPPMGSLLGPHKNTGAVSMCSGRSEQGCCSLPSGGGGLSRVSHRHSSPLSDLSGSE